MAARQASHTGPASNEMFPDVQLWTSEFVFSALAGMEAIYTQQR